jgi:sec-independent protein translocase protein TatB
MPQIGWFELLVIVVIAVLVIGPKDFPIVLKKVGSWIGTVKNYFSEVQKNVNQITDLDSNDIEKNKQAEKKDDE